MSNVASILLQNEILLESGTNELEILAFRLGEYELGINVAKVREVLNPPPIVSLPQAHASVMGVFRLRDQVVPCVSLRRHLGLPPAGADIREVFVLTDFNGQQTAFQVDSVQRIHRISWGDVCPIPGMMALANTPITGVARIDGRLRIMLDFEMISDQVTEQRYRSGVVENPEKVPRGDLRVLLADDSPTVRQAVASSLKASGYSQLMVAANGADAWDMIAQELAATPGDGQVIDLVISDVEMPQVDGFHLTRRIKEHPRLRNVPVMLYSSIVSPDNLKKGKAVGADAQLAKPQLAKVVELADGLISKRLAENPAIKPAVSAAPAPAPPVSITAVTPAPIAPAPIAPPAPAMAAARVDFSSSLWQTFRNELADHARELQAKLRKTEGRLPSAEERNAWARTLHTVKSAAMVVPCDPITQVTHAMEDVLHASREPAAWPHDLLVAYVAWLQDLTHPAGSAEENLALASEMQQIIAEFRHPSPCVN